MYTKEERQKAVDLYIKYGKRAATVIRELEYPDRHMLKNWHKEFKEEGEQREGREKREGHASAVIVMTVRSGRQPVISQGIGGPEADRSKTTLKVWVKLIRTGMLPLLCVHEGESS